MNDVQIPARGDLADVAVMGMLLLVGIVLSPEIKRLWSGDHGPPIVANIWAEPQAKGLRSHSLSVAEADEHLPYLTVSASATLSGSLVAQRNVTVGAAYVEFSQRRKWLRWKRQPVVRATPPNRKFERDPIIMAGGRRLQAGEPITLGRRLLFSSVNLRPLNPPRHPGKYHARLVVELLHPPARLEFDFDECSGED